MKSVLLISILVLWIPVEVHSEMDAERLYDDLFMAYNPLIRPVANNTDQLIVKMSLRLSQIVEVSMRSQIMVVKVWVDQEWTDYKLKWDPEEYGGVTKLQVPAEQVWLPDLVMYNNADGDYQITTMTKAVLYYNGTVVWRPPAIYKSACVIEVEYFPFDEQTCSLKFGVWTYDYNFVDLKHKYQMGNDPKIPMGMDLSEFNPSVEWDIMAVPAQRKEVKYSCCAEIYPDVTFNITMRRKTLFYTVNLIFPCVLISFMSVLVFYLPCQSNEKISLCISIVVSLGVFFLLLIEIIPPTSLAVPLLGRYLIFTNVLVSVSVAVTVFILNVNYRSPSTHKMAPWVRYVFLEFLPKFLCMQRPDDSNRQNYFSEGIQPLYQGPLAIASALSAGFVPRPSTTEEIMNQNTCSNCVARDSQKTGFPDCQVMGQEFPDNEMRNESIEHAAMSLKFIAQHMDNVDEYRSFEDDWTYVALVLDRLFLWVFLIACIVGTILILCQAPSLYDSTTPIDMLHSHVGRKIRNLPPLIK